MNQEGERCENEKFDAEETKKLFKREYQSVQHKKDATRLKDLRSKNNLRKQEKIDITLEG